MVVMAMVALLLSIALPRYFSGLERAKETVLKQDLQTMRAAIDDYYADKGKYPYSLETLVEHKYLRFIPIDPLTEQSDTWLEVPVPDNRAGIYDIQSGAEGLASDGSAFSDW
jgi:general secretion pathway protein G